MAQQELVSVLVISYNSERYIIETLDSIKNQTYERIQLVLSDDGSRDQTMKIAEEWIQKNGKRFESVKTHINEVNHGIPNNANQGLLLCEGSYIKLIAADDILREECIQKNLDICEKNHWDIVFSRMEAFNSKGVVGEMPFPLDFFELSAGEQYQRLLNDNILNAPTAFYKKKLIMDMEGFDENYIYMEDYPMWLKMLRNGVKFYGLNEITVNYRRNESSVTSNQNDKFVSVGYFKTCKRFFYQKKFGPMIANRCYRSLMSNLKEFLYKDLIIIFGNKKDSRATVKLTKLFYH